MSIDTFANRLRRARIQVRMSQDELALAINVTKSAVSGWENGNSFPAFDKLLGLRAALETSLDELIAGDAAAARYARTAKNLLRRIEVPPSPAYSTDALPPDELKLLRQYRKLSSRQRKAMLSFLAEDGE